MRAMSANHGRDPRHGNQPTTVAIAEPDRSDAVLAAHASVAPIDAAESASVSSAPPDGSAVPARQPPPAPSWPRGHNGYGEAAGPLADGLLVFSRLGRPVMDPLPVNPAKISRPCLRADVLSRERLNGWLDKAVAGRMALVIGEAGFGKTTFLADWASRTVRRSSWYALARDDRDWLTFIRHLVAGGRMVDPGFAPATYQLLGLLGPGGPTAAEITISLAEEAAAFGAASAEGFSIVLDDFHEIEANPETDAIVAALLDRTGPGFSLVIASRTAPALPGRPLKGRGVVARIDGEDLCFNVPETDRLFRDAYSLPLDSDVVRDLVARTDGWAALISLFHTSLAEQTDPDPRALVTQLSAARGDLYDFLADEVLAMASPVLQTFLMYASVLTVVEPSGIRLVDPRPDEQVTQLIADAERIGLLLRPQPLRPHVFHPLVQEFLLARLESEIGARAIRELHLRIAEAMGDGDWYVASHHYRAGGASMQASNVIDRATSSILASGRLDRAMPFLDGTAGSLDRCAALILRSRIEFTRGSHSRALALARAAILAASDDLRSTAELNLAAIEAVAGIADGVVERATAAADVSAVAAERELGAALTAMRSVQAFGDLSLVADALSRLAVSQEAAGHVRYAAVSRLNLASILVWLGDPKEAVSQATRAAVSLGTMTPGVEQVSAQVARATGLMQLGLANEAEQVMSAAEASPSPIGRQEASLEVARILAEYDSFERATAVLARLDEPSIPDGYRGLLYLVRTQLALRTGNRAEAKVNLDLMRSNSVQDVAGLFRSRLAEARVALEAGEPSAPILIDEAGSIAVSQNSRPAKSLVAVLRAVSAKEHLNSAVTRLDPGDRYVLSHLAEEVSRALGLLSAQAVDMVTAEMRLRPDRWKSALRLAVQGAGKHSILAASHLAELGDATDAAFLRSAAEQTKALRPAAASIVRRLALIARVDDLGAVTVRLGEGPEIAPVRRKVLGLLCFLATRSRQAATRDETLEALWPDLGPDTGANSLHQTIYYLRRNFDEEFRESISAQYVLFDGEIVTLNADLVSFESKACWNLIEASAPGDIEAAERLMVRYTGKFALDFTYEDWASSYRETLHAAVLDRVEAAIEASLDAGRWDVAISLGHHLLAIDPTADAVELALLRAYKRSGRSAAAAEQYAHYAATLRGELGVEPPDFGAI